MNTATIPASAPLSPVPFHGQTLFVVEKDGQPFVPMRPVVEGMGLAWKPQFGKIKARGERFCVTMMVTQMPGDDQTREVVCLPLRKLPGWLMTINPHKVAPKLRAAVVLYQNECDDALWDFWTKGQAVNKRMAPAEPEAKPKPITKAQLRRISRRILSEDVTAVVDLIAAREGREATALDKKRFYRIAARESGARDATRMDNRQVASVLPAIRSHLERAFGQRIEWRPISPDGRHIIEQVELPQVVETETGRPIPVFKRMERCGDTVKDYAEEIMLSIEKAGKAYEDFLTQAKRDVETHMSERVISQIDGVDMNGIEKHFLRQSVADLNHAYREQTFTMMVAGNAVRHTLNSMVRVSELVETKARFAPKPAALPAGRGRPRKQAALPR